VVARDGRLAAYSRRGDPRALAGKERVAVASCADHRRLSAHALAATFGAASVAHFVANTGLLWTLAVARADRRDVPRSTDRPGERGLSLVTATPPDN
jgi:hypothetical protein